MGKIISKKAVSFICLLDAIELMLMEEGDLLGKGGNGLDTAVCCIILLRLLDREYAPNSAARTVFWPTSSYSLVLCRKLVCCSFDYGERDQY
jgi:hypothetical protein